MTNTPDWLSARPIAHRGLHEAENGILENTLSACKAAIDRGFHIEVDLHPSSDLVPVVFHDLTLERMCGDVRKVRELTARQLGEISIGKTNDRVASLEELLKLTGGKVGLVLEMKELAGHDQGFVEAIGKCLANYNGPVALMSFNHWLLKDARDILPDLLLGLVAHGDERQYEVHRKIAIIAT